MCSCSWSASSSRLSRLGRLDWFPRRPSSSWGEVKRTRVQRLRHRRALQTIAPPVDAPPLPRRLECRRKSRPWSEVKSRRGAPKRINTEGFACPNRQCSYFGNTDAREHALVGDGKHGKAERIQTFRCQACRTTRERSTRHALVPIENSFPSCRDGARCAGRRARPIRRRADLR